MRRLLWLFLVLCLAGCSRHATEMTFFNMTDQAVKVVHLGNGGSGHEIASKRALAALEVYPGERYEIRAGDTVVESFEVGRPPVVFGEGESRLLYVVGGPADLVLADYTDFYTEPGQQSKARPAIRDVINMRDRKVQAVARDVKLLFPFEDMPPSVEGEERIVRVVYVARELIPDDKIEAYLDYELKRRVREARQ